MNKWLLHYDALGEFDHQFNQNLLTIEDLQGGLQEFTPVRYEDGSDIKRGVLWAWVLKKKGSKYLVTSRDDKGNKVKLKDILPIKTDSVIRVSSKGIVYKWVKNPISMRFRPIQHYTFKEFLDTLNCWKGSNHKHQLLWWLMGITMAYNRSYFRVASPPGFGKDSLIDTLGNLFNKSATVENPTIAKFEEMVCFYDVIGVNEVSNLSKADWRKLQIALLATCAFKPMLTKQSKAHGGVGSFIPLRGVSVPVTYNDITNKRDDSSYFDKRADDELLDRLPAFRLWSTYTEDFDVIKSKNVPNMVREGIPEYKKLISTFHYYKDNMKYHNFKVEGLCSMSHRWKTNVNRLLKTIDAYCTTQEEFNGWIDVINNSIKDYKEMMKHTPMYEDLLEKMDKMITNPEMFKSKVQELNDSIQKLNTFIDKNIFIRHYKINTDKVIDDKGLGEFW